MVPNLAETTPRIVWTRAGRGFRFALAEVKLPSKRSLNRSSGVMPPHSLSDVFWSECFRQSWQDQKTSIKTRWIDSSKCSTYLYKFRQNECAAPEQSLRRTHPIGGDHVVKTFHPAWARTNSTHTSVHPTSGPVLTEHGNQTGSGNFRLGTARVP